MLKNSKLKKLKKLKRDYSNERKGYRDRQYDILADTMAIVVELRSDPGAIKALLQLPKVLQLSGVSKKSKSWITVSVVAYVTGAKSENAKKLAWKRARVLEYLHDFHGTPPENIAAEIRNGDGIEALVRLSAKRDPLREKPENGIERASGNETGAAAKQKRQSKSADVGEASPNDDWADGSEEELESAGSGNRIDSDDDTMLVRISKRLRGKLTDLAGSTGVKLIGVWTDDDDDGEAGPIFEVQKIRVSDDRQKDGQGDKKVEGALKPALETGS